MGFLTGKRALIVGLASERSIAHGVGEAMKREGAELAFTYQNDKLKSRVEAMATEWGSNIVLPCDLAVDGDGGKHVVWTGQNGIYYAGGPDPFSVERVFDYGFGLRTAGPLGRASPAHRC